MLTPTRPDDLNPGDRVRWAPSPGGVAKVAHIVVPNDHPTSRIVEFSDGASVRCHTNDWFQKVDRPGFGVLVTGPEFSDRNPV